MITKRNNKNDMRGMTLVEVLITLGIFVAIMFVVATFEYNVITYPKIVSGSLTTAQDAQVLLKTMLKEIRSMGPGADGSYPLVTASTSKISFFDDADNNGSMEEITYYMANSSIYRGVVQPSGSPATYNMNSQINKMILTNVRNTPSTPIFQYFNGNYSGTSSPLTQPVTTTDVRLIRIDLSLDVDVNKLPVPTTYTVQTSLRNLKSNL
jgi:Tfp pilus assembly protein PilV